MPDVYDKERDAAYSPDGSHDSLGTHPERQEAEIADLERQFEAPTYAGSRLAARSAKGSAVGSGSLADREDQAGSEDSGLFNPDDKPSLRDRAKARLTKKNGIIGGIAALLVSGGFFSLGIIQGPFEVIHFAQLMQDFHFSNNDEHSNYRTARYMFFFAGGQAQRGRLGFVGDKYAETWERRLNDEMGLKSLYDGPNNRFSGFEVLDEKRARDALAEMERDKVTIDRDADGRATRVRVDPGRGSFRRLRSINNAATRGTDTHRVASYIGSRMLKKRGGIDFHPLKNIERRASDSIVKYYQDRDKARAEHYKTGNKIPDGRAGHQTTDEDGNPITDTNDLEDETNNNIDEAKNALTPERRNALIQKLIKSGGIATSAFGMACTVKGLGDEIPNYQYENIILPMMRMGTELISTGAQASANAAASQDVNIDELGAYTRLLSQNDSTWREARSIQWEMDEELTGPEIPPGAQPSRVGEKPDLIEALDAIPGLGTACGAVDSFLGSIPIVGDLMEFASKTGEGAVNAALSPWGITTSDLMSQIIGFFAGEIVNPFAFGAELGNIINYGARIGANDQAISAAGTELSKEEVKALDQISNETKQRELQSKSLYARLFDIYDADSMIAQASMKMPQSASQAVASIVAAPGKLMSSLFGFNQADAQDQPYDYGFNEYGFSKELQEDERFQDPFENTRLMDEFLAAANASEQACAEKARANGEDPYPQCEFGYSSLNELNTGDSDFSTIDGDGDDAPGSDTSDNTTPGLLPAGNGQECFGVEVDSSLKVTNHETVNFLELPPLCKSDLEIFLRYRFYITDTLTAHSLACYEGERSSCGQVGMDNASATAGSGASGPAGSATAPCTVGEPYLTDGKGATSTDGIFMTGAGHDTPIRICLVQGFAVNVQIESAVNDMVTAARADGVELKASSAFRSYENQVALRRQNCGTSEYAIYQMPSSQCSPETAKPGSSNHEDGLAIDFLGIDKCPSKQSGSCADPSNPSWTWLSRNASKYGFQQYSKEAWHWSVNGG